MPQTASDFEWSTDAVRSLSGQGDIYLRLCKSFRVEITPSEVALHGASHGSSTTLPVIRADEDHSNTTTSHSSLEHPGTSASSTSAVLPFRAASHHTRLHSLSRSESGRASVQVDLTRASPEHHHSSEDEFPPFPATSRVFFQRRDFMRYLSARHQLRQWMKYFTCVMGTPPMLLKFFLVVLKLLTFCN